MASRRWLLLLAAALLLGAGAVYAALANLRQVVALEADIAGGEAAHVFRLAAEPVREVYDAADADLDKSLEIARPVGARFVAVADSGEKLLASAGDAVVFPIGGDGLTRRSGGRYRFVGVVKSPPKGVEPPTMPPPPNWVPPTPPPGGYYAPNRRLVVEFEPVKAQALHANALQQVWLAVAGAVCLVALAMVARGGRDRQGAAADRLEKQRRAGQRGELAIAMAHDAVAVSDRERAEQRLEELDEAVRAPASYVSTDVGVLVDAAIAESGRAAQRGRWRVKGPVTVEPAGLRWAVRRLLKVGPEPGRVSALELDDTLVLDFLDDEKAASLELGARPGLVAVLGWAALHDASLATVEVDDVPCLRLTLPCRAPT